MAASDSTSEATVKVFVGNLSFKITQDQLKDAFKSVGGVVSANIITRGPRSLGYGFVEFSTQADAEKAVAELNQTALDSRQINVEIAKPRVPRTEAPAAAGESAAKSAAPAAGAADAAGARRTRAPGTRRPRTRRPRAAGAPAAAGQAAAPSTNGAASSSGSAPAPRAPRAPRNTENKQASSTTLFIANLPFSINDQALAQLFIDAGCPPKSARVVLRRERSKGFGFAEFEDEAKQQAALAALDKKTVDGRVLIVKVAFAVPEPAPAAASSTEVAPAASS